MMLTMKDLSEKLQNELMEIGKKIYSKIQVKQQNKR